VTAEAEDKIFPFFPFSSAPVTHNFFFFPFPPFFAELELFCVLSLLLPPPSASKLVNAVFSAAEMVVKGARPSLFLRLISASRRSVLGPKLRRPDFFPPQW